MTHNKSTKTSFFLSRKKSKKEKKKKTKITDPFHDRIRGAGLSEKQMLNEIILVIQSFVLPQGNFRSLSVYEPLRTNYKELLLTDEELYYT